MLECANTENCRQAKIIAVGSKDIVFDKTAIILHMLEDPGIVDLTTSMQLPTNGQQAFGPLRDAHYRGRFRVHQKSLWGDANECWKTARLRGVASRLPREEYQNTAGVYYVLQEVCKKDYDLTYEGWQPESSMQVPFTRIPYLWLVILYDLTQKS